MGGKDYRDLVVWQEAMDLVMLVYRVTAGFPKEETYGLRSQMRRAAVSIPSNIAEGQGRRTSRDFRNFLAIAHGSVREVETHALIAERLHYVKAADTAAILDLAGRVGRRTNALSNSLSRDE
jgi:four helix bundle protein